MFKGLQTGTTQAQAVITTQANLPDNAPIPPAFLTKLYNLKKGHSNQYNSNNNDLLNEATKICDVRLVLSGGKSEQVTSIICTKNECRLK